MSKRKKKQRICDPAMCDECMYLGEGDFVCTLNGLGPDTTVFVIDNWEATEHYLQCMRRNHDGYREAD